MGQGDAFWIGLKSGSIPQENDYKIMWVFTSRAFISIVYCRENPDMRLVRAREAGAIKELFPDAEIVKDEQGDYRYYAVIPAIHVASTLSKYIFEMKYESLKSTIPKKKKRYHDACMSVWAVMYEMQE
ncbi:MAG: hypothetical protein AB1656_04205 [Candidatus Omnitrophota bacterium]